jgi:effector-binding domain-containing protein
MFEPTIKQADAQTVAFKVMRGPYSQTPQGYAALYGWIGQHGLRPSGMPQAVYLTSPDETPEAEAVWELWAPIAPVDAEIPADETGIGVRHVEAQTVAATMHRGPYEEIAPTYERLFAWIPTQACAVCGPPREIYFSDPAEVPPEEYLTEVQVPVAPA